MTTLPGGPGTLVLDAPRTLDDVHDAVEAHPDVPPHYGRTLDALADVLGDIPDLVLVWRGARVSRRSMGDDFGRVRVVIKDTVRVRADATAVLVW